MIISYILKTFHTDLKKSVFCLNLAMKMKLHLNNSRAEKFDRISLLNFYDVFSRLLKFFIIKFS
jgi:hypothetical protein